MVQTPKNFLIFSVLGFRDTAVWARTRKRIRTSLPHSKYQLQLLRRFSTISFFFLNLFGYRTKVNIRQQSKPVRVFCETQPAFLLFSFGEKNKCYKMSRKSLCWESTQVFKGGQWNLLKRKNIKSLKVHQNNYGNDGFFLINRAVKQKLTFFQFRFSPSLPRSSLPIPVVAVALSDNIQLWLKGKTLALTAYTALVLLTESWRFKKKK